ncbi:transcriptional regulator [Amycolatopsis antarctica]|uniref:Transcriptional regulator n=2 Tax=Amycolatopsis antarctica TaxID=1854586 RepID=A0A263D360_9PSEU|nr:transcriptional regulator [Amycolatopsis antarctica]
MLRLLSLLQTGRDWAGAELAARLETSPRTMRRDIERLRELGYPVESVPGPGGSYRLVAGSAIPPLLFTDEEAVAAVVGLRFAALAQIDGDPGAAEGALRKLEQVLPSRLRYRMAALQRSTHVVSRAVRSLDLGALQRLAVAIHAHEHVRFGYTTRTGQEATRSVEPYRQVLLGRHWYLLGWDLHRADWRTFRLDRIAGLTVPGTSFTPREPPGDESVSFVQEPGGPGNGKRGVVRFTAPLAVVAGRLTAEAGTLEAIDEHSCRYVTAAESWEWLAMALAVVGVPYSIDGPPELVEASRTLAVRIADAAGGRAPG